MAPGYEKAMHGLCLGCHREQEAEIALRRPLPEPLCNLPSERVRFATRELRQRSPFAVVATTTRPDGPDVTLPEGAPEGSP